MADIRHRVGIAAPADKVYEALATPRGLASWWTNHVEGESKIGGQLNFFFSGQAEPGAVMEVTELAPGQRVVWHCTGPVDEWRDTNLTFELKPSNEETVVLFTHSDWREPVEFMHHCSTKWSIYLLGLKSLLEGGKSYAYPHDMSASHSWK